MNVKMSAFKLRAKSSLFDRCEHEHASHGPLETSFSSGPGHGSCVLGHGMNENATAARHAETMCETNTAKQENVQL